MRGVAGTRDGGARGCQEQPKRWRESHRIWRNPLTGGSADATLGLGMFVRLCGIWGLVGGVEGERLGLGRRYRLILFSFL